MINNHLALFDPKVQPKQQISLDQKKMIKMFVYQQPAAWIQYIKGFMSMEYDSSEHLLLKIRLISKQPKEENQTPTIDYLPFHFESDKDGIFLNIDPQIISTAQKSDDNILYIKLKVTGFVIALSFLNKSFCNNCWKILVMNMEAQKQQLVWTQSNLDFMCIQTISLLNNRINFTDQKRIKEFCNFVRQSIKEKNISFQDQTIQISTQEAQTMELYFKVARNTSINCDQDILKEVLNNRQLFQCLLICFSFNPFGTVRHNYLNAYYKTLKVNNHLDIKNQKILENYFSLIRAKFLKDVVICTFSQISTEGYLSYIINQNQLKIITIMTQSDLVFLQLFKLSQQNQEHFIYIFIQLWEIFKAVIQDIETRQIKSLFYIKWNQHKLFPILLTVLSNFVSNNKISEVNPRMWQKLMQSMNPLMSYDWENAQQTILFHSQNKQNFQKDLMTSLIKILKQSDEYTKISILSFVKSQIEKSENRKIVKQSYLSYVFNYFVVRAFQCFDNQEFIQIFLQFVIEIYQAEPIRTRQAIIQRNLFETLKKYEENKYVFIMIIKLIKKFVESPQNSEIFTYLQNRNFFSNLRQKYAIYQHSKNIINSLFLNLFKLVENSPSKQAKKYIYNIFFPDESTQELKKQIQQEQEEFQKQNREQLKFKRPLPVLNGLDNSQ